MATKKSTATVNRVCTPGDLERIAALKARGRSFTEIATAINAPLSSVLNWYRDRVEPVWKQLTGKHTHEELAKLNEIERECWRQYELSCSGVAVDPPDFKALGLKLDKKQRAALNKIFEELKPTGAQRAWLSTIMAVIDMRARLRGDYAPTKSALQITGEVRQAGTNPAAANQEMLKRLAARIAERRKYQDAVKAAGGSVN